MVAWRTLAAVAVGTVGVFSAGAAIRLFETADDPAPLAALAIFAIALVGTIVLGTGSRRLSTAYW